jgi:hypothetical protein
MIMTKLYFFSELSQLLLEETRKEMKKQLLTKDTIIGVQTRKVEHMALEFSDMLKVSI